MVHKDTSLSTFFCETITGPHNQHESLMIVGRTGRGKSSAAISIAVETAKKVAKVKGGKWQDYFNLDNIAIITRDEIYRVMKKSKKFSIIVLDDIGVGWNARKWQDELNQALNDIFQTFRTDNMLIIVTLPDSVLIDKVPRFLVHYFMEMEMSIFEHGITVGKVFEVVRKPRIDKIFYEYIQIAGARVMRHVFRQPPDEIRIPYEKRRAEIATELKEKRMQDFLDRSDKLENGEDKPPKVLKKDIIFQLDRDVKAGTYKTMADALQVWNKTNPNNTITQKYGYEIRKSFL